MSQSLPNRSFMAMASFCAVWLLVAPLKAQESALQSHVEQGPASLTSAVDRTEARVADPIEWTLRVEAPEGSRVAWPTLPDQIEAIEVRPSDRYDDIPLPADRGRGKRLWTRTFLVETWETGPHILPAAEVHVDVPDPNRTGERQTMTLRSEPLSISIKSSLPEDADPRQFRDIKGVVDVEPPPAASTSSLHWIIGGGSLAGLAALLAAYYWFGRRNSLPAVWAQKELARLREKPVSSPAERQQCFAEVVDVIRQFLADQFHPEIASQTAEEWIAHSETNQLLEAESRSQVARLLKQHDMSRFARTGIEAVELDEAFAMSESILRSATTAGADLPSDAAIDDAVQMRSSA